MTASLRNSQWTSISGLNGGGYRLAVFELNSSKSQWAVGRGWSALNLAAILLLALTLRLGWLANTHTETPPLSDPQYYHATATNIAEGRGYSVAVRDGQFVSGPGSEGTAFWSPGYSFALAPFYKLFGAEQRAAKLFNAVAGALTVLPVFYLGRRLRGDACGLIAAALFAVAPSLIYWTASLFSESLFTLGVALALAVSAWAGERRTTAAYFATGVVLSATAFVRSQGVVLIVPVAVLLLHDVRPRTIMRVAIPLALATTLFIVPWAVRNQMVMGRPYLIQDNLGYVLRQAHAPYSNGTTVPPQDLWDERPGISFKERELFFDDEGRSRAWRYARTHPRRELHLAALRLGWLVRSDAAPAVAWSESLGSTPIDLGAHELWVWLGDVFYYPLLALATFALLIDPPRSRLSRRALLRPLPDRGSGSQGHARLYVALLSLVAAWVVLHLVFWGEPRYHVPLVPVVVVLAAIGIVTVAQRCIRDRRSVADERVRPSVTAPTSAE